MTISISCVFFHTVIIFDNLVEFLLVDAKEQGLFSPVIEGEQYYIIGKVPNVLHSEEAFGYSFEKMVLYAQSLGLGTTWMAGTLDRALFEKAAALHDDEIMYCVSPIGYAAAEMSEKEQKMRAGIHADERKMEAELFFADSFATPLVETDAKIKEALTAVQLAPSAVNYQPWRIVKAGNAFHFYGYGVKLKFRMTPGSNKIIFRLNAYFAQKKAVT